MDSPFEPNDSNTFFSSNGVKELPLFPLDLVLFPGMKVSLHIFEERYKEMVGRCLEESRPFGVVLVLPEQSNANVRKTKTYRIGCSARIVHVERLAEGRMNIEVEGTERFRIIEQHEAESYRTGIVEPFHDVPLSTVAEEAASDVQEEVQRLLKEFLTRQLASMGQRVVEFELPDDLPVLSQITACILPIENTDKQSLLEKRDTIERLVIERDVLRRAITRLRRESASQESHSPNETDDDKYVTFEPIRSERYSDYFCLN